MKLGKTKKKSTNLAKHTTKNPIEKVILRNFFNTVIKTIRPLNIETVLDAGCGEGFTLNKLNKEKIGISYKGIEYDPEAVLTANTLYPELNIVQGDIMKLPFKNNSFDLVVCTEVLEHLENPKKAYRELLRVSRKYVLLTVPNEPIFTLQRIAKFKNIRHLGAHPEHIQHWSAGEFIKFVKIRGVKLVVKKFPIPWTMVLVKKNGV